MIEITQNHADLTWEPAAGYPAGTEWKILRRGEDQSPLTVLLKIPPGFEVQGHSHTHVEHHYVLEGTYEAMDHQHGPGTYRMIPAHANHGPFRSESGATVLVIWQPGA
jgi:anti-sigma factor ChrR (cupin superfamily)